MNTIDIHKQLQELALKLYEETGVVLQQVNFNWRDLNTASNSRKFLGNTDIRSEKYND